MRYIKKLTTPGFMNDWLDARNNINQKILYNDFSGKRALNNILRQEQKHICCYCQQIITHFQAKNKGGSHNEHLVPQNGENADTNLQMDYNNIYACCNYSLGVKKDKQHCGQAKDDELIHNLIQIKECSSLLKYNTLGEIIPNGEYLSYEEYKENEFSLSPEQKNTLKTIKILNLNCSYLVTERKAVQTKLFKVLTSVSKKIIRQKISEFETLEKHYRFVDMLLYYMRKRAK